MITAVINTPLRLSASANSAIGFITPPNAIRFMSCSWWRCGALVHASNHYRRSALTFTFSNVNIVSSRDGREKLICRIGKSIVVSSVFIIGVPICEMVWKSEAAKIWLFSVLILHCLCMCVWVCADKKSINQITIHHNTKQEKIWKENSTR